MVKGRGEAVGPAVWAAVGKTSMSRQRHESSYVKLHGMVGCGHGMKDSVGWGSVKVVLEVKVHPAEVCLTTMAGAKVLSSEAR